MRKSLGEKRKEISADQIAEITRLYGDFDRGRAGQDPPQRGVRLPAHHRRAAAAAAVGGDRGDPRRPSRPTRGWPKLDRAQRQALRRPRSTDAGAAFAATDPTRQRSARSPTLGTLDAQADREGHLATRSPSATPTPPPITDSKGHPEPDPDLRDNENVPLPASRSRFDADPTERLATATVPRRRRALHEQPRSTPTSPTPGSTTPRPRSATRSRSPATSTATCRPARSRRSTPRSRQLEEEIQRAAARGDGVTCLELQRVRSVATRRDRSVDRTPETEELHFVSTRAVMADGDRRVSTSRTRAELQASYTRFQPATCWSRRSSDVSKLTARHAIGHRPRSSHRALPSYTSSGLGLRSTAVPATTVSSTPFLAGGRSSR